MQWRSLCTHAHACTRTSMHTDKSHTHTQCAARSLTITHLLQQGSGHVDGLTGAVSEPDRTASAIQRSRCKRSQQCSKWSQSNPSRHTAPKDPRKHHPELWQEQLLWMSSLQSQEPLCWWPRVFLSLELACWCPPPLPRSLVRTWKTIRSAQPM